MRIAALILGLLGALASLGLGAKWVSDYNQFKDTIAQMESMAAQSGVASDAVKELDNLKTAGYLMIVMGLASVAGAILALKKAKVAAIIFILGFLLPAIFSMKTLLATFFLLLAGILAFIAKPANA